MTKVVRVVLALCFLAGGADAQSPPAPATPPPASPGKSAPTAPMPGEAAKFPTGISEKYAKEKPGRARMHTCRDQYRANKANGGNAGLHWIQKGGGYYSACLKQLKMSK